MTRRGLLLILSSPSGAGKSTLSQMLLAWDTTMRFSVSATTRAPRPGERDGRDYHFRDRQDFEAMVKAGEMLEHAEVFGNLYGSPRGPVEAAMLAGTDTVFDIDWQGGQQIKQAMRGDVVSIFILPPSMAELRSRLVRRAEDAPEVIARRLANARDEIARWHVYDYVIINDDLGAAYDSVRSILAAERLKRSRATGMPAFVETLLAEQVA